MKLLKSKEAFFRDEYTNDKESIEIQLWQHTEGYQLVLLGEVSWGMDFAKEESVEALDLYRIMPKIVTETWLSEWDFVEVNGHDYV